MTYNCKAEHLPLTEEDEDNITRLKQAALRDFGYAPIVKYEEDPVN